MLIGFIRTIILYFAVIFAVRLMGKRQLGQMQPSELVVAIMISDLASIPMGHVDTPLVHGIVPIATLVSAELLLSFLTLKSRTFRTFISGQPSIVIRKGEINQKEMERLRLNIDDLCEQLRLKNVSELSDIEYAILETNGQLSVIPKADKLTVTCEDAGIKSKSGGLSVNLISDGKINSKNLKVYNTTKKWLKDKLKEKNIDSEKDVFLATINKNKDLYIQKKEKR